MIREYTRQVASGFLPKPGVDRIAHLALGLTGEAGEVADLVKKSQYADRPPLFTPDLVGELGDVLWYLTNMASEIGLTLEDLMIANVVKLEKRHPTRGYSAAGLVFGSSGPQPTPQEIADRRRRELIRDYPAPFCQEDPPPGPYMGTIFPGPARLPGDQHGG